MRLRNAFKNSAFEAPKLVSTKTLLLKHCYRCQGISRGASVLRIEIWYRPVSLSIETKNRQGCPPPPKGRRSRYKSSMHPSKSRHQRKDPKISTQQTRQLDTHKKAIITSEPPKGGRRIGATRDLLKSVKVSLHASMFSWPGSLQFAFHALVFFFLFLNG